MFPQGLFRSEYKYTKKNVVKSIIFKMKPDVKQKTNDINLFHSLIYLISAFVTDRITQKMLFKS